MLYFVGLKPWRYFLRLWASNEWRNFSTAGSPGSLQPGGIELRRRPPQLGTEMMLSGDRGVGQPTVMKTGGEAGGGGQILLRA